MFEICVEEFTGNLVANFQGSLLLKHNDVVNFLEGVKGTSAGGVLSKVRQELVWVIDEVNGILDSVNKDSVELLAAPLNAMLNQVGEVSQGAHWDTLLWWILRVTVALGLVRHDHLGVSFGTEGTRLKEWLLIPHALLIDIETRLDVVDSVDDEVETLPELVVESALGRWIHIGLIGLDLKFWVHFLANHAGGLRLSFGNVLLAEEELTVQVGDLNIVVVSAVDLTFWTATKTHHCEGLNVLASKGTSANHEGLNISELLLHFTTVDLDLVVITAVHWLAVNCSIQFQSLSNVVMEPLLEWGVLSGSLDNLLGNNTTKEGSLRHNRAISEAASLLTQFNI